MYVLLVVSCEQDYLYVFPTETHHRPPSQVAHYIAMPAAISTGSKMYLAGGDMLQ